MSDRIETTADRKLLDHNHTWVPNEIFSLSLPCQEKMVWLALLKFCTWGTFEGARPSIKSVAAHAGMSVSEVRRAITVLAQWGLVTVTRRMAEDGGQTSNAYRLHHPNDARPPVTENRGDVQGEHPSPVTVDNDQDTMENEIPDQEPPIPAPRAAQAEDIVPAGDSRPPASPPVPFAQFLARAQERDRKAREARARMATRQGEPDDGGQARWQVPDTPDQREFLAATGARRFEQKQKGQVDTISGLMQTADLMGDQAWTALESYLTRVTGPLDAAGLPCLPRPWWDDRLEIAGKYRWSRKALLKALLDRERLTEFVRRQVRRLQKGGTRPHDTGQQAPGSAEGYTIFDPASLVA